MFAIGTVIDDKYQITASLGMGGFGNVVKAKQMAFDRTVAIKFLNPDTEFDEVVIRRFEQEAKILSGLKHRNLSLFYGYGFFQNAPYMVMEFVEGRSLQTLIDQRGSLPVERSLSIAVQICDALTCVHNNDVIHRDLKPSNVMLVPSEEEEGELVKLIDFGLSKAFRQPKIEVQRLTEAGNTVGTVEYMSPEQCLGHQLDGRADVYAVGCMLYKCLTGRPPFIGEHTVVVMQQHLCDAPPPLAELIPNKELPPGLQEILNKALAKNLEERYQTAEEMAQDLRALLHGKAPILAHQIRLSQTLKDNPFAVKKQDGRARVLVAGVVVALMVAVVKFLNVPLPGLTPVTQMPVKPPRHFAKTSAEYYALGISEIEHYNRSEFDNFMQPVNQDALSDSAMVPRLKEDFQNALDANEYDSLLGPLKLSRAYGFLAQMALNEGRYTQAGEYAQKAFDSAGPLFIRDVGAPIRILTSAALTTHQYDSAIATLHRLEAELNRQHYKQSNSYVTTETCLAELYLAKGDIGEAKRLNLALDKVVVDTATFCINPQTYKDLRSRIDQQRQRIESVSTNRS